MKAKTDLTDEIAMISAMPYPVSGRRRIRAWLLLLCLAALFCSELADAQRIDALGPEVRKYLRVSTPKVILEHVQIIDGTGAPPIPDRNITIEGGKITAISEGADQPP